MTTVDEAIMLSPGCRVNRSTMAALPLAMARDTTYLNSSSVTARVTAGSVDATGTSFSTQGSPSK
jgi:hypothetical protein